MERIGILAVVALASGVLHAQIDSAPNPDILIIQEILKINENITKTAEEIVTLRDGRVVAVNLTNKDFSQRGLKKLPESIGDLTACEIFICNDNDIVSIPQSIGRLTNLHTLSLANNAITEVPSTIGSLKNLRELDLRNNELTSLPEEITDCASLVKLQLWGNELTVLPSGLGKLQNLRELYAKGNRLKTFPASTKQLKITYLDVHDNALCGLSGWVDTWLKKFDERYVSYQKCW